MYTTVQKFGVGNIFFNIFLKEDSYRMFTYDKKFCENSNIVILWNINTINI